MSFIIHNSRPRCLAKALVLSALALAFGGLALASVFLGEWPTQVYGVDRASQISGSAGSDCRDDRFARTQ